MRVAIYSRYSSSRQRETSIEDQVRLCRDRAKREGWAVVAEHADQELSGALPFTGRPGATALLDGAMSGKYDAILFECLDRSFRDIVEQEQIIRRIEFAGIRIVGVSDGYDSLHEDRELHRGFRGLINQQYLRDLAKKVHRGLTGQVTRGLFAGGLSYGYRTIEADGGRALEVNPDHARWVVWIHERYAEGRGIRSITHELNRLGAVSPRGGTWAVSALYGSPAKGTGILNNELYTGRYVWNRSQWIKDPDTGKRCRIERPRQEWRVTERPELQIIPDALWSAVRARMDAPGSAGGGRGKGARPRTLLGGLLRCGVCGGAVVAVNAYQYGCAAHHDRGPTVCAGVHAKRDVTETRLLAAVRDDLLSPGNLAHLHEQIRLVLDEQSRNSSGNTARPRLAALEVEIRHLTDAVAAAGWSAALADRLRAAETERARLAAVKPAKTANIPALMARYRRLLADLPGTLKREPERARAAIRELIGDIRLVEDNEGLWAEMDTPASRLLLAAGGEYMGSVAGDRYRTRIRIR